MATWRAKSGERKKEQNDRMDQLEVKVKSVRSARTKSGAVDDCVIRKNGPYRVTKK